MKCPVLFLDRDGVINQERGYISRKEEFIFNELIFEVCKKFKSIGYKIVIVTNQSGIGRKKIDIDNFHKLTLWMLQKFERKEIRIELVIASALDPESEKVTYYEEFRRKPQPGMFIDAGEIIPIDFQNSFMLGDRLTDGVAAQAAGIGNIYIISDLELPSYPFVFVNSLEKFLEFSNTLV